MALQLSLFPHYLNTTIKMHVKVIWVKSADSITLQVKRGKLSLSICSHNMFIVKLCMYNHSVINVKNTKEVKMYHLSNDVSHSRL